jgi:hypothetical protein
VRGQCHFAHSAARIALLAALITLATGCVSRVADHDGERPPLWDQEPDVLVQNRNRSQGKGIFSRFLRAGGTVECSGWLFKKQTTHTYARLSFRRDGPPIKNSRITTRAVYLDGLFEGVAVHNSTRGESSVETYETVSVGFNPGFECSCVYVTATAPVMTGRTLVVTGKVCPYEE